eukprot:TRINITY_DN13802_c0_g1_i1.p1 TRINITY_DN13802_c0_g1~~TRINITY_DN13802_c0_g1_i1.p1  ORF type:complete len:337 (-),score=81.53 TRINITY_DN13802_c0_g1_i1:103-1113(-)
MLKIENQSEEVIVQSLQDKNECKLITHIHFAPTVNPKINLGKIIKILNTKCPNIERSDLYASQFTEENIATFISNRNNLTQFNISTPIGDACLTYLSLTCKLTHLSLLDDYLITDEGLIQILSDNPQLTVLNLRGCSKLNGSFLKYVSKDIIDLRINNTNIDNNQFKKYLPKFTKLTDLRVGNVDDLLLATIAATCKNLQVLDIQSSPQISDLWVGMVVSQSQNLIRLNLAYCQNITGQFLKNNITHPKLAELWLTGIQKLNIKLLTKFITNAPTKIKILHVSGIQSINDSFLEIIPLDELNFLYCQNTTISVTGTEKFLQKILSEKRTNQVKFFY